MSYQALADIKRTLHMLSMLPLYNVDPRELMTHFNAAPVCPDHCRNPHHGVDLSTRVFSDKSTFQVLLEVQQFAASEITVRVVGEQIVVEGKHEEKEDEHGCVSRHFVRKYHLPSGHEAEDVVSTLSSDGVLTITAPRKVPLDEGERLVPIAHTGPAHHAVLNKHHDANAT